MAYIALDKGWLAHLRHHYGLPKTLSWIFQWVGLDAGGVVWAGTPTHSATCGQSAPRVYSSFSACPHGDHSSQGQLPHYLGWKAGPCCCYHVLTIGLPYAYSSMHMAHGH